MLVNKCLHNSMVSILATSRYTTTFMCACGAKVLLYADGAKRMLEGASGESANQVS